MGSGSLGGVGATTGIDFRTGSPDLLRRRKERGVRRGGLLDVEARDWIWFCGRGGTDSLEWWSDEWVSEADLGVGGRSCDWE